MAIWDKVVDFGKDVLGSVVSGITGGIGDAAGNAASGAVTNILGGGPETQPGFYDLSPQEQEKRWAGTTRGLEIDRASSNAQFWERASQVDAMGGTLQEFLGSPAAGGMSSSAGSNVMGNQIAQREQAAMGQQFEAEQRSLDRKTQLTKTAMDNQTAQRGQDIQASNTAATNQASVQTAQISAGAAKYMADTQNAINKRNVALGTRELTEIALPRAAAELKISEQKLKTEINNVATTDPKFVLNKLFMQMGPENQVATVLSMKYGINPQDMAATAEKFKNQPELYRQFLLDYKVLQSPIAGTVATISQGLQSYDDLTGGLVSTIGDDLKGLLGLFR